VSVSYLFFLDFPIVTHVNYMHALFSCNGLCVHRMLLPAFVPIIIYYVCVNGLRSSLVDDTRRWTSFTSPEWGDYVGISRARRP